MIFKKLKRFIMPNSAMLEGRNSVAILFSGGPAPAANSVISAVALSFMNAGHAVIGIFEGYKHLINFKKGTTQLIEGKHYIKLDENIGDIRNKRGVYIKTARANPGKDVKKPEDLNDPAKNNKLYNVMDAFESLNVGLLISIGGDDTLRTANLMFSIGMPAIHIPKTIDNDYFGIPWTFGYWTSVDVTQKALLNLQSDSESTGSYFIAEIMGRKAGWLAYSAGIAGEAIKMVAVEDLPHEGDVDIDKICNEIVDIIQVRESKGRYYGVVCVAEGLADRLPEFLLPKEKDPFGHTILGKAEIGKLIAETVARFYKERFNKEIKVLSKQIGYETRTAPPISFDVVLGSMLGYGAYQLFAQGKIGHMVSVVETFDIHSIPFSDLINPVNLTTKVRTVSTDSDLYHLKNALTYRPINK